MPTRAPSLPSCAALLLALAPLLGCEELIDDELPGAAPVQASNIFWEGFTTTDDHLALVVDGEVEPFFAVGSNLGVGVPGTQPGEVAVTYDQYRRWFAQMSAMGSNAFRMYTLHYPRFYQALYDHNQGREDPLYVLHGIWLLEDVPEHDLYNLSDHFDNAIEEVLLAAHGENVIEHRYGEAYGEYTVDISPWVLGWVAGREVDPWEIDITIQNHPDVDHYDGVHLDLPEGTPVESWLAERLDYIVEFERSTWGVTRPISFSSWPTLDPILHRTEPEFGSEDWQTVDLGQLDLFDAPGGYFATYHAYPYYPDFVSDDPGYRSWVDDEGPNSYLGYLSELADHYADEPLLIGEFGVPSSWGNAHYGHSGMNHGGHDELVQGQMGARMFQNMEDSACAGGMWFAWMDEWWKQSWITNEIEHPVDHRKLWPNRLGPEQNYGVIAFDVPAPDYGQWEPLDGGAGPIAEVIGAHTLGEFVVRLELNEPLQDGETITVGFDTYADELGESILPLGEPAGRRVEFALTIDGSDVSQYRVTEAYDVYGIWHALSPPGSLYHSIATDGAPWHDYVWLNDDVHVGRAGIEFPATEQLIGRLPTRRADEPASNLHAVVIDDGRIDIRIPWTLLHFTDPSQHHVLHDDRATPGIIEDREVLETDGIAVVVVRGAQRLVGPRWLWDGWDVVPETTERVKPSFAPLAESMTRLGGPR